MAWEGRALVSWVLREMKIDFRQNMDEMNSGQGLRGINLTAESSKVKGLIFCFFTLSVSSLKRK